jgi:hypothetical protein
METRRKEAKEQGFLLLDHGRMEVGVVWSVHRFADWYEVQKLRNINTTQFT